MSEPVDTENVVAYIRGTTYPDEYVVISSHLDHIGISQDGEINNGADDDGSGTVAVLEIAQAFKKAADEGNGPKRSVVFLHVTGEERGLLGSQYYTDFDPVFPLEQTVADLNIDMIGRIDPKRDGVLAGEGLSNKCMEYFAMGLPAVVSSIKAARVYYDDSMVTYFEPGNAEDLARKVIDLYSHPARCRTQIRNALRFIENHGWHVYEKAYFHQIDRLVKG